MKNPPARQQTRVQSLGREDLLRKEMATRSSVLVWETPWTQGPAWLLTVHGGHKKVRHDFNN